jgi:uncharacterized protein (TIGR02646 family)
VIKVNRTRPGPAVLSSPRATKERTAATAHYGRTPPARKPFSFKVYKDPSVREALEAMFRNKCAYCETRIGAGDEPEIEHWRPKGVVKESNGVRTYPGYYWLASDWDNLFLACLKCNRPRKYRVRGGEEDEEMWARSGKGMLFPLAPGNARAVGPRHVAAEYPLLLNPCADEPEEYLEFLVLDSDPDREATVRPRSRRGHRRAKGQESINIYSLNRPPLVDERRRALKDVQWHLAEIRYSADKLDRLSPRSRRRAEHEERIERNVKKIARHLTPDSPYLAMKRQAIDAFLEQEPGLRARLEALLGSRQP